MSHRVNNTVRLSAHFEVRSTGIDVDPTVVSVTVTDPTGTATTYVYGTDVEVVKENEGDYYIDIVPTVAGVWTHLWESSGTAVTAEPALFEVEAASVPSAYALRGDVENIFGASNVSKWADLENLGSQNLIASRIDWALVRATEDIDDRLRGGPYPVPFTAPYAGVVVDACARLAGVLLYESRGITDVDEEDGVGRHALAPHRRHVERWYREVLAGTRSIGVLPDVTNIPKAI